MNKTSVKEYMATNLVTLKKDMNIYYAIGILLQNNISGAPVIDEKSKLIGIISEKDCLKIFAESSNSETSFSNAYILGKSKVEDYMTTSISTVNLEDDLFSIVNIFLKNNFRRLPVLSEERLVGQISRRDVLKAINDINNNHKD